jgi:HD-like signal output (HDOD) protein
MKQRLIYADENLQAPRDLQRHSIQLKAGWEMVFLQDGPAVLGLLAKEPCAVLVASAGLPGTSPDDLMGEAFRRQPGCIRILLTTPGARDPVPRCVGLIHQAFPRTGDPHQLQAVIANAMRVGEGMASHPEVKEAITALDRLPSVPKVYQELRTALEGEHATWRQVGAIIQQDMGMTARVLSLANSAFFGLQRRVESPQEAVHFLGTDVVQALVLAYGLFDQTGALGTHRISLEDVWVHSLRVAKGARALAAMEGLDRRLKADAFMGGLLHDAGVLVLAKAFPDAYDRIIERCATEHVGLVEAEREAFGLTHAEAGAYLLGLWGLQAGILEAVSLHHTPGELQRSAFDHVLAVHLADEFSRTRDPHPAWEHTALDTATLEVLGLRDNLSGWRKILEAPIW